MLIYLLGEWVNTIALSKPLGKDELALVEDGDAHAWDTSVGAGLLEDVREVSEELFVVLCCWGRGGGSHGSCLFQRSDRVNEVVG